MTDENSEIFDKKQIALAILIFELDHPLTGVDKQKRIQSVMREIPSNLHYIPIDFTEKTWERNLIKCSQFEQSKISFCSLL